MQASRLATSRLSESMLSSKLKGLICHIFSANSSLRSIAAGQNTTLLLAKPNEKFSDMPRHPEDVNPPIACVGCNKDYGEDDSPLECDKVRSHDYVLFCGHRSYMRIGQCDAPWHLQCLSPPLDAVPDGEWFCPDCEEDPGAGVGAWAEKKPKPKPKKSNKRAASPAGEDGEGENGGKRKAHAKGTGAHTFLAGRLIGFR